MRSLRPTLKHENRALRSGAKYIAGIDEAGRGPLAGPVVACAIILKKTKFLNRIGDSKALTSRQREDAACELKDHSVFGVGIVGPLIIDKINILQATLKAMRLALNNLPFKPDAVLIDGPINLKIGIPSQGIIDGDAKSLTIAAASIIAKVTRDKIMEEYDRLYPAYGFINNKGYGTPQHLDAIKRHGPSPIHRLSFAPLSEKPSA